MFNSWKKQGIVTFKEPEKKVFDRALEIVKSDYTREAGLDIEVNKKLDELEKSHPGEFQRGKMFSILKTKMAADKKIIL